MQDIDYTAAPLPTYNDIYSFVNMDGGVTYIAAVGMYDIHRANH